MSESTLIKEFQRKDVQRLRNIVSKNSSDKTTTQVGYTKENIERKEKDIWEENGKTWTIKNGIKMTTNKLDLVKSILQIPLICPKCHKAMINSRLNKQMYYIHKMCSNCVIDNETKLKQTGEFDNYQQTIVKNGIEYHIKEMEDILLDISINGNNESFITESGDIEEWKGRGLDQQTIIENIQEYIQKLRDSII
jgi:hypothetical protein